MNVTWYKSPERQGDHLKNSEHMNNSEVKNVE